MSDIVERAREYEVMEQARLNGMGGERELALRAEIERLQSCLYAQESVPQLYAEIKRLREIGNATFMAMCAYRDSPDEEVFQDAIDVLGAALKDTTPAAKNHATRSEGWTDF